MPPPPVVAVVAVAFCCCELPLVSAVCAKDKFVVAMAGSEKARMAMTSNSLVELVVCMLKQLFKYFI